jgi:response regulator RpfG family c-di-GMP phosphodiesterase
MRHMGVGLLSLHECAAELGGSCDDHPVFRNGMRTLFASLPEMEVAGEATTGDEVITLAASLQPDVILMDLKMPWMSGAKPEDRAQSCLEHLQQAASCGSRARHPARQGGRAGTGQNVKRQW